MSDSLEGLKETKKRGAKVKAKEVELQLKASATEDEFLLVIGSPTEQEALNNLDVDRLPYFDGELDAVYYKHRCLVEATSQLPFDGSRACNILLWYFSTMSGLGLTGKNNVCALPFDLIVRKIGSSKIRNKADLWAILNDVTKIRVLFHKHSINSETDASDPGNIISLPLLSAVHFDSDNGVIRYHLNPFFQDIGNDSNNKLFDIDKAGELKKEQASRLYEIAIMEISGRGGVKAGPVKVSYTFEELKKYNLYEQWNSPASQYLSKVIKPAVNKITEHTNVNAQVFPLWDSNKIVGATFIFTLVMDENALFASEDLSIREAQYRQLCKIGFPESEAESIISMRDEFDVQDALDRLKIKIDNGELKKSPIQYLRSFLTDPKAVILSEPNKAGLKYKKQVERVAAVKTNENARRIEAIAAAIEGREKELNKEHSSAGDQLAAEWPLMSEFERREFFDKAVVVATTSIRKLKDVVCQSDTLTTVPSLRAFLITHYVKNRA